MAIIGSLSLSIFGGSLSGGLNSQPLVSIGEIPKAFSPISPSLVDEQQAWFIVHAQDYTLYATWTKQFPTADGQPGALLICLFFPPQRRLADGNSPLTVLDAATDCFMLYGIRGGKLPEGPVDATPFKDLMSIYHLGERPTALPIMQGHSPVALRLESKNQLDALMRHSRYTVLGSVGRLEMGYNCQSTIALSTKGRTSEAKPKESKKPTEQLHASDALDLEPDHRTTPKNEVPLTGGIPLDDDEPETPRGGGFRRFVVFAAILLGVFLVLFVGRHILNGISSGSTEEPLMAEQAAIDADDDVEVIDSVVSEYVTADSVATDDLRSKTAPSLSGDEAEAAARRAKAAKEAEAAAEAEAKQRKAEAEARRKAAEAEEAKRKAAAEQKLASAKWKSAILAHAAKCPIQLRLGVRITSITCTDNAVTYTVSYEEVSKYNSSSYSNEELSKDRRSVIQQYGAGLPAGVRTTVIQKDKAGRTL